MTLNFTAMQVCDRCQKPFHETSLKGGDVVPTVPRQGLRISVIRGKSSDDQLQEEPLLEYEDICPSCWKTVENYIGRIDLSDKKKAVPKASKPKKDKTDKEVKTSKGNAKGEVASAPTLPVAPKESKAPPPADKGPAPTKAKAAPKVAKPEENEEPPVPEIDEYEEPEIYLGEEVDSSPNEPAATVVTDERVVSIAPKKAVPKALPKPLPKAAPVTDIQQAAKKAAAKAKDAVTKAAAKDGGNSGSSQEEPAVSASSTFDKDRYVTDPETGDQIDIASGEVISRGSGAPEGEEEYPF